MVHWSKNTTFVILWITAFYEEKAKVFCIIWQNLKEFYRFIAKLIKQVVIETTGVCDITSVMWHYVFWSNLRFTGLFFQNSLVDHISVYTDTNK